MPDSTQDGITGEREPKSEILRKIKAAENEVREMISASEAQRERTLAGAKREALEIREIELKAAQEEADKNVQKALAEIDAGRKKILEAAEVNASEVRSVAASKIEDARRQLLAEMMRAIDDQA